MIDRFLLAAALSALLAGTAFAQQAAQPPAQSAPQASKITILHVNDLDRMEEAQGQGGLARVAAVVAAERAKAPDAVFTHGGDAISPSILAGFDKGAHMIDLMNQAGVEVMAPGNHEFDFGPEVAVERLREARFPVVAANVLRGGQPLQGTVPSWTTERGGVKLGFFGLTTLQTPQVSSSRDVEFRPIVETARAAAKALRDQGAEIVVALAHTGMDEDLELVQANVADVVLSGHDHLLMSYYNGKTVLVESASQGDFVTVLELAVERTKGRDGKDAVSWRPTVRTVSTATVAPDPKMAAAVKVYEDRLSKELDVPVGRLATPMDSRRNTVRGGEAAIGNLIADALRERTGSDVAVVNGGGIRADRQYDAGMTLTRRDILKEMPFGNKVVKLELTGAQLLAALENGVSQVQQAGGRFPQVSGLSMLYDPQAEPGKRVREAKVGGQPIDPARRYAVATNDFMAGGGDGYVAFREGRNLIDPNAAQLMASTVIDHVAAKGTVEPRVEGRVRPVQ
jgi:2',3'-cyclic-nucleotide 2'-phosphodiesterase (5'-nucleotidase family)